MAQSITGGNADNDYQLKLYSSNGQLEHHDYNDTSENQSLQPSDFQLTQSIIVDESIFYQNKQQEPVKYISSLTTSRYMEEEGKEEPRTGFVLQSSRKTELQKID